VNSQNNDINKLIRGLENLKSQRVIHIWPLAHFFFGFSVTLPLVLLLFWVVKKKEKVKDLREFLKKRAIFGIFGGLWAMVPDIDHFLDEPVLSTQSFSDIFFFHISFDRVLPETDLFFAAEMLLVFAVVIMFSLATTVESFHRLHQALFGRKEEDEEEEDDEKDEDDEKVEVSEIESQDIDELERDKE
jgi:hypothetical protein